MTATTVTAAAVTTAACTQTVAPASATATARHTTPPRLVIGTDFPLQGGAAESAADINRMIEIYLDRIDHRVGKYRIDIKVYDDSTRNAGEWTDAQCAANAKYHVRNKPEIAVIGTYNSGCAEAEVPIMNRHRGGPMLMISPSSTYPGLTEHWDTGEPRKYYPTGIRNFARVEATDDLQGVAGADFARRHLHTKRVFVVNDRTVYGRGLAQTFVRRARHLGIKVVGNRVWDPHAAHYTRLFRLARSRSADAVYLSGFYDNNGHQIIADKISVLGSNKKVPLLAPDAFSGYPDLDQSPAGRNMYLTYSGEPVQPRLAHNPVARKLVTTFEKRYGRKPSTGYALDAVAALQVIDAAIGKSDGTRAGVTKAVFSGHGITIPTHKSVLGRRFSISPHTGDTDLRRISVDQLRNKHERFVTAISV